MNTSSRLITAAAITGLTLIASSASASVTIDNGFEIVSPCDNAQVEVVWMGSQASYTGELSWINPNESGDDVVLWTNQSAVDGQSLMLPDRYNHGERVDFRYSILDGVVDVFSTANEEDWGQFVLDDSNPHDIIVGIEDIRLPGGDADFNDAQFRVLFHCGNTVPTPGSFALLSVGGVLASRRRR